MVLAALIYVTVAGLAAVAFVYHRSGLQRSQVLAVAGLEVATVGIILTPGIAWGDRDSSPGLSLLSTILFYAGVALLIAAAVRWRRERAEGR